MSRQIGGMGIQANRNPPATPKTPIQSQTGENGASSAAGGSSFNALNGGLPSNFTNKKTAKVLFDYEATDPSEMSVSANQVSEKTPHL